MVVLKFRAWDTFHNKWVKHFYITENGLIYNMEQPHRDLIGAVPIEQSGLVVMQSTGVFDKNGQEIFEGDVVNIFGEKLSKIYYSDGAFCVDILIGGTPLHAFLSEQLEIIGNIHRNPELMEEVLND
ncbi:YopX family protein [Streptococcus suis]|uniref:YopX family protein n=1 Tax=Streptococcus suis TaxID=1307 RepID=UPI002AB56C29|nr:YopX family protein [Streptococcus suis]MDY7596210.1 YopX family protein [Streptococcus suis]